MHRIHYNTSLARCTQKSPSRCLASKFHPSSAMSAAEQPRILTSLPIYAILPLTLPALPHLNQPQATHYLYLRPHAPQAPTPTSAQSLFLTNIPFDTTPHHLKTLFATAKLGNVRIKDIEFDHAKPNKKSSNPSAAPRKRGKKRKRGQNDGEEEGELVLNLPEAWDRELHVSGSSCVVTFVDVASKDVAWKAMKNLAKAGAKDASQLPIWTSAGVSFSSLSSANDTAAPAQSKTKKPQVSALGSVRYSTHNSLLFPSKATLQSLADSYLSAFSSQEASHAKKLAALRSAPDENGFITVVKGARTGPARTEEVEEVRERRRRKEEKNEGKWGKGAFYRWEVRERRREEERRAMGLDKAGGRR